MAENLEDLEKKFILNEDMEHEDIGSLTNRILRFCKVDNKGFVIIEKMNLKIADKVMLVLSARYLANRLQQKLGKEPTISEVSNAGEIAKILREKETIIAARLNDLKIAKKIISPKRGIFKVASYEVEKFIKGIEENL